MYLLSLKNSMVDAPSRQPGEECLPDDVHIEDLGSGPYVLQGLVVFTAIEDWLKVVVPNLDLAGCI